MEIDTLWVTGVGLSKARSEITRQPEKDCLTIVWAILQLRPYLDGQKFITWTAHHSLQWVLNLSGAQWRIARWRLRLLKFDFKVQYSPGREHHEAVTMSRLRPSSADAIPPAQLVD
jgi:RNase H-like domain found in reverse transcriptase